jgi:glycosyltransferase involved in cell wall biosynthesis
MISISICICTRKRKNGLRNLLFSLDRMILPPDANIEIIVVENESDNYSEYIVREFTGQNRMSIRYYLEPAQGIANARNRSVAESDGSDFCCFVDDDQVVATDWLYELVRCQREFDADGVWGVNPPVFDSEVPSWINRFYEPDRLPYGTIVRKAFTNCLLIRKNYLDKISGPFDPRFNYSGGEDTYLTSLITQMGGIIRCNPRAVAYEVIPRSRTSIAYIIKRTYRISNTELLIKSFIEKDFSRFRALERLVMRFCYGLLISVPLLIFGSKGKLTGILKMANAAGGFSFIAGRNYRFYK